MVDRSLSGVARGWKETCRDLIAWVGWMEDEGILWTRPAFLDSWVIPVKVPELSLIGQI